jgi:broad specificity phosphatase PhoE
MNGELKKNFGGLKRRPFLTPLWLAAIAGIIALMLAAWLWTTLEATTVVVIRHAEKQLDGSADPPLSPAGEARAALLAKLFGDAHSPGHIDAIYVSPTLRSRRTVEPLAASLGLTPLVAAQDDARALAHRVLREHAGQRVLIVGHSDTVPCDGGCAQRSKRHPAHRLPKNSARCTSSPCPGSDMRCCCV